LTTISVWTARIKSMFPVTSPRYVVVLLFVFSLAAPVLCHVYMHGSNPTYSNAYTYGSCMWPSLDNNPRAHLQNLYPMLVYCFYAIGLDLFMRPIVFKPHIPGCLGRSAHRSQGEMIIHRSSRDCGRDRMAGTIAPHSYSNLQQPADLSINQ